MKTIQLLAASLIAGTIVGGVSPDYTVRADSGAYEEMTEEDETGTEAPLFSDIAGHWSEEWVRWAVISRYAVGYSDGTFRPDQFITEAEFLKLFYLALGYPKATIFSEEWTAASYRMAKNWKHQVPGLLEPEAKFAPITRQTAARIIASALGKNYNDTDSIVYLLGNNLLPLPDEPTIEGFKGNEPLTRAETLEWVRMLRLKGIYTVEPRPQEPSDRELLPALPEKGTGLKDFTAVPVDERDFGVADSAGTFIMGWGSPRSLVEQKYGVSTGQDVFNNEMYKDIYIHYDAAGKMDLWQATTALETGEPALTGTLHNIRPGISTLADVLAAYGTYADANSRFGVAINYIFEKKDGKYIPRLSPYELDNIDDGILIGFLFDDESLKVKVVMISSVRQAMYPQ